MNRRNFGFALLVLAAAPFAAQAQPPERLSGVGVLAADPSSAVDSFFQGLRALGYVEGKNIRIERRFTGNDSGKAQAFAQELAALKVDVIYAPSSTFVEAARRATSTIPIVFSAHNDPIGNGHIRSLAHPGGNITGVTQMGTQIDAKRLELLKEIVPHARLVGVLSNPTTPSHVPALKEITEVSRKLGLKLHMIEAASPEQFELAFEAAAKAGDQALLLLTSPLSFSQHKQIVVLALKHRVPTMFAQSVYVDAGGLISYGPNLSELSRRAATYVDRILKGASPATMAVEQPTIFELRVNLRTAKSLGLSVPQSILLRADQVIE